MSAPPDITDSHSDSDWLDIASTDRDSDDNDSIYSSRETDHDDLARSRSRRSSVSYGSSRDGDVDAWEGLIDDSADEGLPNDVLAPDHHVPSLSQHPAVPDSATPQEASSEELRVKEGLDQSMISTLSSSRSSSLHASTVQTSSRDLRLSFPDPITSSCRELSTSYEDVHHHPEVPSSPIDSAVESEAHEVDDEDLLSASETFSAELPSSVPPTSGPELKVFLYGSSTSRKWALVDKLLEKVTHGAGLGVTPDLVALQGSVHRLMVSGSSGKDHAFPRIVTVLDKTVEPHDTVDDPALADSPGIRPLAVVFLPCHPLHIPERALVLPVLVSPLGLSNPENDSQRTLQLIPNHQVLRLTSPEESPIISEDSIEAMDSTRAFQAFSRLWSSDNNVSKGLARTHTFTIIAILSLVLGVVVRAAIPIHHQLISFSFSTVNPNYTSSSLWQIFRPVPYRERLPPSMTSDSPVVSASREFSLSIFSAESTSVIPRVNPTDFRRVVSSSLVEHLTFSKDLVLQPPHSVLPPDNRPKALSVIPETSPTNSHHPGPSTTGHVASALVQTSVPNVVKEYASVASAIVNQDMQDIFDALDELVKAISRQTQIILKQATTFIEESAVQLKNGESFETIKETLHAHNERARKRAKEIKEIGTKWLYEASEVIATSAQFSTGMAWEMAEGVAQRAEHARGKAKEIAAEIQDLMNEYDKLEVLAWDSHAKPWGEWMERIGKHANKGKMCKSTKHKLKSTIFC